MTTYYVDFERRAEDLGPEVMATELEAAGFESLTDIYNSLVTFLVEAKFDTFPQFTAEVLYRDFGGGVTNYRGHVAGHCIDSRGRFTVLIANGDKILILKPREGEV
ncbi:hypothetical protein BH772_gp070 [Gordonia phage Bachita]|uniref:Uncharacterized protein n=1 Tax=Gordonia phage Bachita TaxID=1838061 RepID=A0A160DFL7_9CAUD|nr:hypothetical protein BH772_gp070 [Gordonia phage Bachita]ANA86816.1 hypothetical protein PBI_BACHITA_141 [Gordonia phage Bachita]QKY79716.1 hypothetical protein SEA_ENGINEER_140 [Gordonia Phage Engineer]